MGLFLTFEGIEGSGKSTQIERAAEYLRERGNPCLSTSEPGGSILGRDLRTLLLGKPSLHIVDRAELLLFTADRAQHVEEVIFPALSQGMTVLCDRFSDATIAYQGYGRGLDRDIVVMISDFASRSLKPDHTVLLDIPPEQGVERARQRSRACRSYAGSDDRFEGESLAFHRRVREGYLTLAAENPTRFHIVDGRGTVDQVAKTVRSVLSRVVG